MQQNQATQKFNSHAEQALARGEGIYSAIISNEALDKILKLIGQTRQNTKFFTDSSNYKTRIDESGIGDVVTFANNKASIEKDQITTEEVKPNGKPTTHNVYATKSTLEKLGAVKVLDNHIQIGGDSGPRFMALVL